LAPRPVVDERLFGVGHISPSRCERVLRARQANHVTELAAAALDAVHTGPAFVGDNAGRDPGRGRRGDGGGGGRHGDRRHGGGRRGLLRLQLGDARVGAALLLSRPGDLDLARYDGWWWWLVAVPSRRPRFPRDG